MRSKYLPLIVLGAGLAAGVAGCESYGEPAVGVSATYAEPGYYYEPAYPNTYYYYDGHRYWHRDYVPRGYVAHEWHRGREWHRDGRGWRR